MEPAQAAAELATIRTLMERVALYRRALAPMTLAVGAIGFAAGTAGVVLPVNSPNGFAAMWCIAAVAAIAVAFVVVRRQSLQASEPLWTPPTRRVFAALAPALCLGGALAVPYFRATHPAIASPLILAAAWIGIYGLGLNAAGFFMPRGIRWFGFAFVAVSGALILVPGAAKLLPGNSVTQAHWLMAITFGLGHLAYGIYLRITERPSETHVGDNPNRRS